MVNKQLLQTICRVNLVRTMSLWTLKGIGDDSKISLLQRYSNARITIISQVVESITKTHRLPQYPANGSVLLSWYWCGFKQSQPLQQLAWINTLTCWKRRCWCWIRKRLWKYVAQLGWQIWCCWHVQMVVLQCFLDCNTAVLLHGLVQRTRTFYNTKCQDVSRKDFSKAKKVVWRKSDQ